MRGQERQAQAIARLRAEQGEIKTTALCAYLKALCAVPAGVLDGKPIAAFALGATPVTWAVWDEFLALAGGKTERPTFASPTHPVVNVSPEDAERFCAWLSKASGVAFRLPTSRELEYAAREGGKPREYPWGNTFEETKLWGLKQREQPGTAPVGRASNRFTNAFGLSDMVGNVAQWCSDGEKGQRYNQGGSWASNYSVSYRCSSRTLGLITTKVPYVGFRIASS